VEVIKEAVQVDSDSLLFVGDSAMVMAVKRGLIELTKIKCVKYSPISKILECFVILLQLQF
jgi:hypothetical protein